MGTTQVFPFVRKFGNKSTTPCWMKIGSPSTVSTVSNSQFYTNLVTCNLPDESGLYIVPTLFGFLPPSSGNKNGYQIWNVTNGTLLTDGLWEPIAACVVNNIIFYMGQSGTSVGLYSVDPSTSQNSFIGFCAVGTQSQGMTGYLSGSTIMLYSIQDNELYQWDSSENEWETVGSIPFESGENITCLTTVGISQFVGTSLGNVYHVVPGGNPGSNLIYSGLPALTSIAGLQLEHNVQGPGNTTLYSNFLYVLTANQVSCLYLTDVNSAFIQPVAAISGNNPTGLVVSGGILYWVDGEIYYVDPVAGVYFYVPGAPVAIPPDTKTYFGTVCLPNSRTSVSTVSDSPTTMGIQSADGTTVVDMTIFAGTPTTPDFPYSLEFSVNYPSGVGTPLMNWPNPQWGNTGILIAADADNIVSGGTEIITLISLDPVKPGIAVH